MFEALPAGAGASGNRIGLDAVHEPDLAPRRMRAVSQR